MEDIMRKLIKNNVYWIGKIDWELQRFHGDDFSINNGSSQNAYLIEEEKTVLIDTVWMPHADEYLNNLMAETDLDKIDFIVVNHGEMDHSGALPKLMARRPDLPIYCTANAVKSLVGQYHHPEWHFNTVKTGDSVDIGKQAAGVRGDAHAALARQHGHLHDGTNILFQRRLRQHFAVEELFNDRADQCKLWEEAIKYYVNILHPFSPMVKKKVEDLLALNLPIDIIATSHGVIWRDNPRQIVDAYYKWSQAYQEDQVTVVYDSMWGGTEKIAHRISRELAQLSPDTRVKLFNIAKADKNDVMTEVFKSKAIAVGSPTVNQDILSSATGWLAFLKELRFKNKKAAVFGCYGWSGEGNKLLREKLQEAGFDTVAPEIRCSWNPLPEDLDQAKDIAAALLA